MKEFINQIVNEVLTEETTAKNVVAIYPGRFQPMGSHHAKVYKWVQSKFGRNNSYISTSTKVEKPKSPLSFSEKEMVIRKHGFKNIIQINAMYNGEEYFKKLTKFKPTETALVMIVGEKDGERLSPKYFQKISQSDNLSNLKPYLHTDENGNEAKLIYWMAAPHISLKVSGFGEMSGTTIRAALGQPSDNKEKLFKDIMGFYDKRIYDTIVPKFEELYESLYIPKSVIERWAKTKSKSKLNEISVSLSPASAKMVDDGPNFYIPNNKVFMNVSLERAAKLGWEVVKQITSGQYDDYYEHPIYPQGPPQSVPDAENSNVSNDFEVDNAQEKWLDHMTRKMALVGWSVVKDKAASDDIKTDNEIIKQSLGEGRVEGGEPEAMYVADGQKRRLNRGKPESWYKQLGFTQLDVPEADWIRGRLKKDRTPDLQTRKVYYKVDNVKHSTLKDALQPVGVDKWIEVEEEPKPKKKKVKLPESVITEIPMDDLVKIDQYADKQLNPVDVVLTDKHFFDRLTDLRNDKPITSAELIGFFKRLSKSKKKFIEFLKQYGEVVAKDNRTNINIPFMTVANKLIAKTVMRKSDFKTSNPKFAFEGLFTTDNALKPYEKLLIGSIIEFMRGKYGISSKIIVKKKQSRDLFGDIVLNDNTLNKDKFYLHFNPNASYSFIIESIIHELIHVKQISKGELRPSSDYKELLWKGKPAISVSDYKKFQRKDYNEYKKLPWEAEAYSGMKPLYREFLKSKQLQSLKGKDENLDYIISNLTENLMMGYPDQKWIDDHNKELKRLRNKFDDNEDDYYTVVDEGVELEKFGITDFKSLFNKMPSDLKKRVYNLKNISQRLDKHPEGNVLKHTIVVVNRSLKDDDIDIAIAAMFHDIGKDETEGIHPTNGHITHYGHEDVSATLVSKYKNWIKSVGGNPANILYIVRNHMRYKQLSNMRPHKQNKLKSFRAYDKLDKFSKHDRGGLHESSKLVLQIPSDINKIHTAFKKNGKKLYVVGGAVRDAILGNTPKDFDLATDAKPDEVISIANKEGFKTTEVGKSFGVVTVNGHEIATFRKDFGVGRRPKSVDYTDIEGDVKRRDLTINALFYDMDRKEIVDLVGGIQDLKNKKIRTVGDATTRFDEDPLRKLRILRFQAKLGGKLDNDSFNALKKNPTLKGVSADRIKDEFVKSIQTAKNPKSYMELVDELGFTPLILPTLNIHKSFPNENDYIIFLSSILRNNDVKKISNVLNTLKYSNKEINDIVFLVSLVNFTPERIYEFKKLQASTTLSDNQIIKFGSLIGKDVRKFIKFNLSVKGSDVPTDIKGSEIGNWIRNKEIQNYINEDITLDVNIGDTILMGKFKNKKVVVKSIGTDEHGMPTINGKKVVTFRKLKTEGVLQEGDYLDEDNGLVKCAECNNWMRQIQYRHLKYNHNMTMDEYKSKHPNLPLISESSKNKGIKNPMSSNDVIKKHKKSVTSNDYRELQRKLSTGRTHTDESKLKMKINNPMNDFNNRKKVSDGVKKSYENNESLRKNRSEIGKQFGFGTDTFRNYMIESGNWRRDDEIEEFEKYKNKVRQLTKENYRKHFYEIPNAKKRGYDWHLDHKYSIFNGFKNNIPSEVIAHYSNLEVIPYNENISKNSKNSINLNELITSIRNSKDPIDNRVLLTCGGAAGHMMHLSDDLDLTFGELKQIVKDVLQGNIKTVTEKLDGQNLMVSWKGGKAIFARNKGHIKGFGTSAMDALGVKQMFSGRGDLEEAFYTAAFDLQNAISKLTQKQRDKIFGEGSKWMNFEVMYPATTNVIPYNHTFLVFHGSVEYDESGNPIGSKSEDANILAGMIKQVNAHLQSKYEIRGPVKLTITPAKDFSQSQSKYLSQINKLQSEFKLKDSDKVGMYHYKYWETFVDKKSPTKLDDVTKNGLVLRWAYDDKSFRLDKNTLPDVKTLEWAKSVDKGNLVKLRGENMNKFDVIFLQLGAEVLKNMSGFLAANPDTAVQSLRKEIEASIPKLMASDDPKMIEFATRHIQRLEKLGGVESIVPTEGIVFNYNGKLYKMTGVFAPLNQLLGAFRYGR
jgi:tRNA nucleotidyltransferase/poly(A) polymerase